MVSQEIAKELRGWGVAILSLIDLAKKKHIFKITIFQMQGARSMTRNEMFQNPSVRSWVAVAMLRKDNGNH